MNFIWIKLFRAIEEYPRLNNKTQKVKRRLEWKHPKGRGILRLRADRTGTRKNTGRSRWKGLFSEKSSIQNYKKVLNFYDG